MIHRNTRSAQPIDAVVGQNLKRFRKAKKLSQTELGEAVGISFQQVQKYEKGTNRIGASRLWQFSDMLNAPIQSFYHGLSEDGSDANGQQNQSHAIHPLFAHPQGAAIAEAFLNLNNSELETQVLALCQVLSRQTAA